MSEMFSLGTLTSLEVAAFAVGCITLISFIVIFLITQLFLGDIDSGDASDADIDYDGGDNGGGFMKFISFQSVFLGVSMICWSFLAFMSLGLDIFSIPLSVLTGVLSILGLYFVKNQIKKLNTPNTTPFFTVYPTMVGKCISGADPYKSGMGVFTDQYHQSKDVSFISEDNTTIDSGDAIVVTRLEGQNIYVTKLK